MRRRHRRRGVVARITRLARRGALAASRPARRASQNPVRPIRARPERLSVLEEYHYRLQVQRNPVYSAEPTRTSGEILIDLPFDRMGQEAIADGARGTATAGGSIDGRFGWLALYGMSRSDVARRLDQVRPWPDSAYRAFPLVLPIIDDSTERLEQRIEAGWQEREQLFYTPAAPVPFPFEFNLFMSRDSAVPTLPRPSGATSDYRLGGPNSATGQETAIHVELGFTMQIPPGVEQDDVGVTLERLAIKWPVPVVASQFRVIDQPGGRFWVDSRFNQLVIDGVPVGLTQKGADTLVGQICFRIAIRQPAVLQGCRQLNGKAKVAIRGIALSGLRGHYFDAAGYPQSDNCDGRPLFEYRSELHADFEYWLADALQDAPALFERRYTWPIEERGPNPFREIESILPERGFDLDTTMGYGAADRYQRWWASRTTNGQPLILDLFLEKQEPTPSLLSPIVLERGGRSEPVPQPARGSYDLTIHGYYRGQWDEAIYQMSLLEEQLRHRLRLRKQGQ